VESRNQKFIIYFDEIFCNVIIYTPEFLLCSFFYIIAPSKSYIHQEYLSEIRRFLATEKKSILTRKETKSKDRNRLIATM
jgi:hypothetical protein